MCATFPGSSTASYPGKPQLGGEFFAERPCPQLLVTGLPISCMARAGSKWSSGRSGCFGSQLSRHDMGLLLTGITSSRAQAASRWRWVRGRSSKWSVRATHDSQLWINWITSNSSPCTKNGPTEPRSGPGSQLIASYLGKQQLCAGLVFTPFLRFVTRTSISYQPFGRNPGRTPLPRQAAGLGPGPLRQAPSTDSPQMD
jgi:hypothetical protein